MSHDTPPDDPGTDAGAQSDDDRGLPKVTRRMALGLLGLGVLAGGETTAVQGDVGGGPDSDELAHVLRPTYEGPESELPAPGVEGRRFTVTDTGGTYPQWSELRDTGSAWEPINFGAGSVNTNVINKRESVDPDGGFDAIQSVLDGFSDGVWEMLELQPGGEYQYGDVVRLEVPSRTIINGHGATLVGNGDESTDGHLLLTNKDWDNGDENIRVRDLNVSGQFSDTAGAKNDPYGGLVQFTECQHVHINGIDVTDAYRHHFQFVKTLDSSVKDSYFHGTHGDDPVSVSDGGEELGGTKAASVSRRIRFENCTAAPTGADAGFEVDDGPAFVYFDNCTSETEGVTGFKVKVHADDISPHHVFFSNCHSEGALSVDHTSPPADGTGPVRHIYYDNCYAADDLFVNGGQHISVDGGLIEGGVVLNFEDGFVPSLEMDNLTTAGVTINATDHFVSDGCEFDSSLAGKRGVDVHPDGNVVSSVSDIRVSDCDFEMLNEREGVYCSPYNGATVADVKVSDNVVKNTTNGIVFAGTNSNYTGISRVVNNDIRGTDFNAIYFEDNENVREHVITLHNQGDSFNQGHADASPFVPANPTMGTAYLDDGTNTADGNIHRRYYDGSAFVDL